MRPLRALRAIGRFKDLRMLVELLLGCIPMLANVFALIAFILFVFGILGVQLFNEGLRGRCFSMEVICVLQCVAVCCSVLQCVAVCCSHTYG